MRNFLILYLVVLSLFLGACSTTTSSESNDLIKYIKKKAYPLNTASDLDILISTAGAKKLVLLGESSHGTHEFYLWRNIISKRLIREHGFNFIVVEGDFASLFELNRYVKNLPGTAGSAREVLEKLERWPAWMWSNEEIVDLAEWLRAYNDALPLKNKVGFYGKDIYGEWNSKDVVLQLLKENNRSLHKQVKRLYGCFDNYSRDSWAYAQAVQRGSPNCTSQTQKVVDILLNSRNTLKDIDDYTYFYILQNAMVVKNAEEFYRNAVVSGGDVLSWHSRVNHMHQTVQHLLSEYGKNAKGIVWAHNTHIGDASYTEMANVRQTNIGQLSRRDMGAENVFLIGLGTYQGTVIAGASWGAEMQTMRVPASPVGSIEDVLARTGLKSFYLIFDEQDRKNKSFMQPFGNRAIGVVYNPASDIAQYINTIMPMRYDAFLFFLETKALNPLVRKKGAKLSY